MRLIPWVPGDLYGLRNFGGNSSSSTQNTENVTQPTSTVGGGSNNGGTINAVSTTAGVTLNEESPQALNSLDQAVQATENVALQALNSEQATAGQTQGVLSKAAETGTQQLTPIIIAVAIIAGLVFYFSHRKA